jgi:hypothetical protein
MNLFELKVWCSVFGARSVSSADDFSPAPLYDYHQSVLLMAMLGLKFVSIGLLSLEHVVSSGVANSKECDGVSTRSRSSRGSTSATSAAKFRQFLKLQEMMSIHNDDTASLPDTNDGDLSVTGDGSVVSSSDAYLQFLQFTMFQNVMGASTSSTRPGGANSSSSTAASMALMLKSVQSQQEEIASQVHVLKSEMKTMFRGLECKLIETNIELCQLKESQLDHAAAVKKQIETVRTETMTKFSSIDSQLRSTANNISSSSKRLDSFE